MLQMTQNLLQVREIVTEINVFVSDSLKKGTNSGM